MAINSILLILELLKDAVSSPDYGALHGKMSVINWG